MYSLGNQTHPLLLKLGKRIFWKSELYSYYYTNVVTNYLKINLILKYILKSQRLHLISAKYYFFNNRYLLNLSLRTMYWKKKCSIRRICKYTVTSRFICTKYNCLFFKKAWWMKRKVMFKNMRSKQFMLEPTSFDKLIKMYINKRRFLWKKGYRFPKKHKNKKFNVLKKKSKSLKKKVKKQKRNL